MKRSILLVFAHPDDESGIGGTITRYTRQGVPVDLICATRGEKGTRVDVPDSVDTGAAREAELRRAAALLGIRNIYFIGYIDDEIDQADRSEVTGKIISIMQEVQPGVVISFGPDGITGHPDHVSIGKATTKAFKTLQQENKEPRKLYYVTIPQSLFGDDDKIDIATRSDDQVTTTIDVGDYVKVKIQAMLTHRSQQDMHEFAEMIRGNLDSSFAAKEHFYLASPRRSKKETDLFQ